MHSISLVFENDVERDDIEMLKTVHGCLGVSAYKNTVNLYFRRFEYVEKAALALAVQRLLVTSGAVSSRDIYSAVQEEAMS